MVAVTLDTLVAFAVEAAHVGCGRTARCAPLFFGDIGGGRAMVAPALDALVTFSTEAAHAACSTTARCGTAG
jgi:hypothetical protein